MQQVCKIKFDLPRAETCERATLANTCWSPALHASKWPFLRAEPLLSSSLYLSSAKWRRCPASISSPALQVQSDTVRQRPGHLSKQRVQWRGEDRSHSFSCIMPAELLWKRKRHSSEFWTHQFYVSALAIILCYVAFCNYERTGRIVVNQCSQNIQA